MITNTHRYTVRELTAEFARDFDVIMKSAIEQAAKPDAKTSAVFDDHKTVLRSQIRNLIETLRNEKR